jgi:cytochrome c-type biogenesis protein
MTTPDIQHSAAPSRRLLLIVAGFIGLALLLTILSVGVSGDAALGLPGGGTSMLILAPAAFLAGVLSFLSPCTLPILPAYFAWTFQAQRERVVTMTIAFFLGLATTMVVLGASATALSKVLFRNLDTITLVGGIIIIVFGVMSLLGKGFSGVRLLQRPTASVAGSYLYGATFALGWTSCVGPILGALLTLLATQGFAVIQGGVLAFIYALGLGTPLILVAGLFSRLGSGSAFWRLMRGRGIELNLGFTTLSLHTTSILSGVLLIAMGVLLATGQLTAITAWSQTTPLAQWSVGLEQALERLMFGR